MAKLFLAADETFTLLDDATVFGSTGNETVKIYGTPDVDMDANIERIELSGASTDYTYKISGTTITISKDGSVVATLNGLNQECGVAFTDGTAALALTGLNSATLGGTQLPTTDSAVVPATIDTNNISTLGELFGTTKSVIVSAAGSDDAGTKDVTYIVEPGSYTYSIANFGSGDVLDVFENAAMSVINSVGSDGTVDIVAADPATATTATLTLTGLSAADDASLFNLASMEAVFGVGTVI